MVHLIPTYKTKLKSSKPVSKVVHLCTQDKKSELGASFDCTDWEVLWEGTLDEARTATTDYVFFNVEFIIPTKTLMVFPNNKPISPRISNKQSI